MSPFLIRHLLRRCRAAADACAYHIHFHFRHLLPAGDHSSVDLEAAALAVQSEDLSLSEISHSCPDEVLQPLPLGWDYPPGNLSPGISCGNWRVWQNGLVNHFDDFVEGIANCLLEMTGEDGESERSSVSVELHPIA